MSSLRERLLTFVAEQYPFAVATVEEAWDKAAKGGTNPEDLRVPIARGIRAAIEWPKLPAGIETTPGVTARERLAQAEESLIAACDGFLRREAIAPA